MSTSERRAPGRDRVRTGVVWDAVVARLEHGDLDHDGVRARVVDIGGGTGGFAVRLAREGHTVTVVDPSPDALAALARRADEAGVAGLVTGVQGDLSDIGTHVAPGSADVVLCHGVLEVVPDPAAALRTITEVLREGGLLSLLVAQRHAAVVARAMAGHFQQARTLLDDPTAAGPTRRFTTDEVAGILDDTGFEVTAMHAVRVFVDLVPSSLVDLEPGAASALVELEKAVADRPEYLSLGTQLHVLDTRR
jgi:SAM-dependent methyltransferase